MPSAIHLQTDLTLPEILVTRQEVESDPAREHSQLSHRRDDDSALRHAARRTGAAARAGEDRRGGGKVFGAGAG